MHPITIIEIIIAIVPIFVLLVIALLIPKKVKKAVLLSVLCLTILEIGFISLRPVWIDYQVSKKTEQINQYLVRKYPNESWEIKRKEGRQYNPYHLNVIFKNEPLWIYDYTVDSDGQVRQTGVATPSGKFPDDGKHREPWIEPKEK